MLCPALLQHLMARGTMAPDAMADLYRQATGRDNFDVDSFVADTNRQLALHNLGMEVRAIHYEGDDSDAVVLVNAVRDELASSASPMKDLERAAASAALHAAGGGERGCEERPALLQAMRAQGVSAPVAAKLLTFLTEGQWLRPAPESGGQRLMLGPRVYAELPRVMEAVAEPCAICRELTARGAACEACGATRVHDACQRRREAQGFTGCPECFVVQ